MEGPHHEANRDLQHDQQEEILLRLTEQSARIEELQHAVNRIRRIMTIRFVVAMLLVLIPAIGLYIVLPRFIGTFASTYRGVFDQLQAIDRATP